MRREFILAVFCALLLGPAWSAFAADPTLVGWWWFDDGVGTTAADSSNYKNNGTLTNGPTWAAGKFGKAVQFDGVDDYVTVPHNPSLCVSSEVTVMAWINTPRWETPGQTWQGILSKGEGPRSYSFYTQLSGATGILHFSVGATYVGSNSTATVPLNKWVHLCAMVKGGTHYYYIDGVAAGSGGAGSVLPGAADTQPVVIGRTNEGTGRSFQGMIDDVRIYNRGLTQAEVQAIMTGQDIGMSKARGASPADGQTDVPQDTALSWTAGQYAATHDVYLGKTLVDVNSASRAKPAGLLVSQDQTATTYSPTALLDFGQTYYWRVDEVNKAPDNTIFKGSNWSFTVEPYSYPITGVKATASTSQPSMGPEKTIDGSGLTGDQHGIGATTMWMSTGAAPNWIQYEFDGVYKLDKLVVWNSNQAIESYIGFGAKDVTVEYSVDGTTWTALAGVPPFGQGNGLPTYTANTTVNFGAVAAKFVKLTIIKTWGGLPTTGLSEVRFFSIPVQARAPQPANGAAGQTISTTMNWRPGREATSHKVFFGSDQAAVTNGTATAKTVTGHTFDPGALAFGTKYYWRVDEVAAIGTTAGTVWSFTTQEFAVVDDFESYNDKDNCIFDTWIDGLTDTTKGGSQVGYNGAPFAETTIVHGGKQSMPLAYDNSKTPFFSETTRSFDPPQDLTINGATQLGIWFRGYPAPAPVAVTETGGKMTLTGDGTDIWNASDDFVFAYKTLTGDGSLVARVVTIGTGTNTWAKGGVMIRDSLNGGSMYANTVLTANSDGTAGNGACFQFRPTTDSATGLGNSTAAVVIKPPYWVKIERKGDSITGSISANGTTWTPLASQTLVMTAPVYIGLCVTAHQAGEQRTFTFDGISSTGGVTGSWQGAQISSPRYNDAAGLYAIVEDSSGAKKTVVHPDPAAAATGGWTLWPISLSDLTAAGVKTTKIKKLTIGVGDRNSPKAGGAGMLYVDDIGYGSVAAAAAGAKLDLKITAGANDAEEHLTAAMDITSTDLEMPYEDDGTPSATDPQLTCLRYNVPVTKGAKIVKAYVEFTCDETKGGSRPVNLIVEGQLAASAAAFTTNAKDLTGRAPWTKAQVKWAVENWTAAGQKSQTPDLSAILQEIIDQAGWVSNNGLVLAFRDDPGSPSTGIRCADAYEDEAAAAGTAPVLHIELAP